MPNDNTRTDVTPSADQIFGAEPAPSLVDYLAEPLTYASFGRLYGIVRWYCDIARAALALAAEQAREIHALRARIARLRTCGPTRRVGRVA